MDDLEINIDAPTEQAKEFEAFARLAAENPEFVIHVVIPHHEDFAAQAEVAAEQAGVKVETRVTTTESNDHFGAVFQA